MLKSDSKRRQIWLKIKMVENQLIFDHRLAHCFFAFSLLPFRTAGHWIFECVSTRFWHQ